MEKVSEIFQNEIFKCEKCRNNKNKIKFMNHYMDFNKKINNEKPMSYLSRRNFILDYIKEKNDIEIMIIGLAPGLNGCGFSGIPFTGESNAIVDLKFVNYHNSKMPYQEKESANLIYDVIKEVSNIKNRTVKEISKKIYMINSCQCVPLKESEKSIKDPSAEMKKNCWYYVSEIINDIKLKVIIVLGEQAYRNTVSNLANISKNNIKKLTECILDGTTYQINNIKIIPEIHPSPQNRNNANTKDLYPGLKKRLVNHICNTIK
ncbi:uracil-DNA glycosylase family protein [Clostridium sp.]|uniref:uracil-DNA glycosylase family protein n=1 Tax=Clostridium sp. TaxID=1506 RepID=UPI00283D2A47|nr:uracil-DNA glycosylase family protein [Clostridium sp.]MDR3595062.1 uracil-DNA glycosylase family protein [Clostridium sp.]